jgi:hypothetical protein
MFISPILPNFMMIQSIHPNICPIKLQWKDPLLAKINIGPAQAVLMARLLMENSSKQKDHKTLFQKSTMHINKILFLSMVIRHMDKLTCLIKLISKGLTQRALENIRLTLPDLKENLHIEM